MQINEININKKYLHFFSLLMMLNHGGRPPFLVPTCISDQLHLIMHRTIGLTD